MYKFYSNANQDNALLSQWMVMSNYTFNFGYALGYVIGINCISMSDYWARYGGQWGPASQPVYVGPGS